MNEATVLATSRCRNDQGQAEVWQGKGVTCVWLD
jgi:hypothetical protein